MTKSEGEIVNNTRELFPGIIVGGMELSEADSHPRMVSLPSLFGPQKPDKTNRRLWLTCDIATSFPLSHQGASFAGMISSGVRASMIASKLYDTLDCDEFGEVKGIRSQ